MIHRLPAEPAYLRVKTLRRLNALGAVALKSSVYVLPECPSTLEDFHWLRREIVDGGGEATLSVGRFLEGASADELIGMFRAARNQEYEELCEAASEAMEGGSPSRAELRRLRRRMEQVGERDHFRAPGRAAAEHKLLRLERIIHGEPEAMDERMQERPEGATWVTRAGVHVDRMASGWLIRRFVDPKATFKFVAPEGYEPAEGELRFDMFEGEFTHEGDRCTFETMISRFGLEEPELVPIAEIIHDIDCKDDKFGRPEAQGIACVIDGIAVGPMTDDERLAAAYSVFDSLFERFRSLTP